MTCDYEGRDVYQSMLSDWDMDAAFQCASEPYLKLRVDVRLFEGLPRNDILKSLQCVLFYLLFFVPIFGNIK